jgi:hypothetical protein
MSDTIQILQLPGAQLASIDQGEDEITLHFSQVQLVQEMENAIEDSLWTQAIALTIKEIELEGELPACPCEIKGGDLIDNIFTYRDHAPLPINWQGEVSCKLIVAGNGTGFTISGAALNVNQIDNPRYIKHVKKT